ncbi:MAG: IS630 family transposase [Clostridia bacterium]|nr:IS630 family transposase [Clostridia bacterium]
MSDPSINLWCEDEVHFYRHSTITRMWAIRGEQPRVRSASTREKLGFFGALDLRTGRLLTKQVSTFDAETFHGFLAYLLDQTEGVIYLILDNASWHKARALKPFFEANRHRLIRCFLPPYSPELNPIERVWRITRRQVTHNRYFKSLDEQAAALTAHFRKWNQPNPALRVLCANI